MERLVVTERSIRARWGQGSCVGSGGPEGPTAGCRGSYESGSKSEAGIEMPAGAWRINWLRKSTAELDRGEKAEPGLNEVREVRPGGAGQPAAHESKVMLRLRICQEATRGPRVDSFGPPERSHIRLPQAIVGPIRPAMSSRALRFAGREPRDPSLPFHTSTSRDLLRFSLAG